MREKKKIFCPIPLGSFLHTPSKRWLSLFFLVFFRRRNGDRRCVRHRVGFVWSDEKKKKKRKKQRRWWWRKRRWKKRGRK
jgi:hypothetical protein